MRIHFEKRKTYSAKASVLTPVISFLVSLILTAVMLAAVKINPAEVYAAMFRGAFGTWRDFSETLVKAIPLILTSLGVATAFKLKFWNIGAEGQLVLGGIGASWVALFASAWLPPAILLPAAIIVGAVAGSVWAGVPALLKVKLGVDETLTTLMLNYVAIIAYDGIYTGPWRDPDGFGFPGSAMFPEAAWLPRLTGRTHAGLIFALIIAAVLWFAFYKTKWGFELQMIGNNKKAARVLGVNIGRNIIIALLISGAISGIAGACEVTGIARRLQQGLSLGYGYTAIIIAWMSRLNPAVCIPVSIIMAGLLVGGDSVQIMMGVPSAMGQVMQGMILFPMLAGSIFSEYRLRLSRDSAATAAPTEGGLA
ncbi:MAG: ABC transporter permease [Spirochaetales bacterium]|uniref:ABC transporter permease n=1 Tax=Candidatus Thalassospirochaeta sargassi TaxID=3119039 RepID=A0AAJ1MKQ1_9SPIO|nr:ABC transporter permease [Spirochaetales bacterium]